MNSNNFIGQVVVSTKPIFVFMFLVGVLLGHGLPATEALGQDASACLACHGSVIDAQKFSVSVHGAVGCIACHGDIKGFPHPPKVTPPNCTTCHGEAVAAYQHSIHGQVRTKGV